jgi:hypothetical protein
MKRIGYILEVELTRLDTFIVWGVRKGVRDDI